MRVVPGSTAQLADKALIAIVWIFLKSFEPAVSKETITIRENSVISRRLPVVTDDAESKWKGSVHAPRPHKRKTCTNISACRLHLVILLTVIQNRHPFLLKVISSGVAMLVHSLGMESRNSCHVIL